MTSVNTSELLTTVGGGYLMTERRIRVSAVGVRSCCHNKSSRPGCQQGRTEAHPGYYPHVFCVRNTQHRQRCQTKDWSVSKVDRGDP
jgi:hypothetical protein